MSAKETYYKYEITIRKVLLLFSFLLFTYLFINHLFQYVGPFVISFMFSIALERPIRFLNTKLKLPRGLLAIFFISLFFFIIIVIGGNLISLVSKQAISFFNQFDYYTNTLISSIQDLTSRFENYLTYIPADFQNVIPNFIEYLQVQVSGIFAGIVKGGTTGVVNFVPNLIMYIVLIFISGFYFIKDRDYIYKQLKRVLPEPVVRGASILRTSLFDALFGYIKAQLILMSVSAAIIILGLTILRQEYALFLSLIIAFVDALPIFGSGAFFWPWALYAAVATGDYQKSAGLLIIYGCIFLMRQFLEPKILSAQIGIHPIVTLISVFAGLKIFGFLGFIIGPIIAVVAKVILTFPIEKSDRSVDETIQKPEKILANNLSKHPPDDIEKLLNEPDETSQSWEMIQEKKGTKLNIQKIEPPEKTAPDEKKDILKEPLESEKITGISKDSMDPLNMDTLESARKNRIKIEDNKTAVKNVVPKEINHIEKQKTHKTPIPKEPISRLSQKKTTRMKRVHRKK